MVVVGIAADLLPLVDPCFGGDELILKLSDLLLHSNQFLFKTISLKGPPISNNQDTVERRTHPGTLLLHQHPQQCAVNQTMMHCSIGGLPLAILVREIINPIPDAFPQIGLDTVHVVVRTPHGQCIMVANQRSIEELIIEGTLHRRSL